MKKTFTYLLATLLMGFASLQTVAAEEYDKEYVANDLLVTVNGESSMTFQGSVGNLVLDFTVFGAGYGTFAIEGYIGRMKASGTADYSYSEELKSNLLVAVMDVPSENWKVKVTMYSQYIEPTDTIVCENMTKSVKKQGWTSSLVLSGTHAEHGAVSFTIAGCDGSYGEYSSIVGKIGGVTFEGKGTWKNAGEVDELDAILANADTTRVFHVMASVKAQSQAKPTNLMVTNATFSEKDGILYINGSTSSGKVLSLELLGYDEIGFGTYEPLTLSGKLDDVDIANMQGNATLAQSGSNLILKADLMDAQGKTYALTMIGKFVAIQEIDVVATNLTVTPLFGTDLQLKATTTDGIAVELQLIEGVSTQYGDYGYDEYGALVINAKYGNIALTLSTEVVATYYQLGDIDVFEGQFVDEEKNIYTFKLSSAELPSSIQNNVITMTIEKAIENGQFIILKNGVKYNVAGAIVQ